MYANVNIYLRAIHAATATVTMRKAVMAATAIAEAAAEAAAAAGL